jgi:hypothetical protein
VIGLVVNPVKDLARAKSFYGTLVGVEPYADSAYYVGFRVGVQEVGLDPNDHTAGLAGPIAYWDVKDGDGDVTGLRQKPQ